MELLMEWTEPYFPSKLEFEHDGAGTLAEEKPGV